MSLHTWCHQGLLNPSSHATFTLNPHWVRAATGKKRLAPVHMGSLRLCATLCDPVDCGLPGFPVRRGFSRQEYWSVLANTGAYWPTLVALPSRALYFLLPQLPTPLSTWCCQNPCNPSSCTTSTPGLHRGKSKSFREASGANPVDDPHAEVEIKPQLKPRGSVEEDPKPSHQLYQLQIKYT